MKCKKILSSKKALYSTLNKKNKAVKTNCPTFSNPLMS